MTIRITPQQPRINAYPWDPAQWVDRQAEDPRQIRTAILSLGADASATKDLDTALGELVLQFPEDFAPFGHHGPPGPAARTAWIAAIKSWVTGFTEKEEETVVETREVPLCVFDSPKQQNAKTTYGQSTTGGATLGWSIEVLGTGFGSDCTVFITQSSQFISSEGDRKLVFAPLQIRIVKVALYKYGKLQNRFLRTDLAESEVRDANGIRSIDDSEWHRLVEGSKLEERFDLSGDTSSDVATYKRSYEVSGNFEAKLGFKAFDLESTVTAKCSAKETVEMELELPAGSIYELKRPAKIAGFHFEL